MVRSGRPDGSDRQQSLGELVALATKDISTLLRYEISLAKSEFKVDIRRIGATVALAAVGLSVLCLFVILLFFALAYGIADAFQLPIFAGFLCSAGACILIALVVAGIAFLIVRRVTGMKMTRKTVMDDLGMLRRSEPSPNGSGPAVANPEVGAGAKAGIPPARP
jgi:hypothetical protein